MYKMSKIKRFRVVESEKLNFTRFKKLKIATVAGRHSREELARKMCDYLENRTDYKKRIVEFGV